MGFYFEGNVFSYSILWLCEEIFCVTYFFFLKYLPFCARFVEDLCIWNTTTPESMYLILLSILWWDSSTQNLKVGHLLCEENALFSPWSFEEEINWMPIWMGGISLSPSECLSVDQRSIWLACWDEPHHSKSSLSGLQAEAWLCLSAEHPPPSIAGWVSCLSFTTTPT